MNVKQLFALTALALAAGSVLAEGAPGSPLGRAEVVQSVLAARAAGTLIPAGEGVLPGYLDSGVATSTLTRAEVNADVLQARADGDLIPSGQSSYGDTAYQRGFSTGSILTRAEVKAEVLQARAEGTLIPAGQGGYLGHYSGSHVANKAARPDATSVARSESARAAGRHQE